MDDRHEHEAQAAAEQAVVAGRGWSDRSGARRRAWSAAGLASSAGGGRPLEAPLRDEFAQHFGFDFGAVRIHTDGEAGRTALRLHANAYTVGSDIVFAPGAWAPATFQGRLRLAHELAHVVQQAREPGLRGVVQREWNACAESGCPARERGELARAARARLAGGALDAPVAGFIVQPFAVGSSDASALASDTTWASFVAAIEAREDRWEIVGFSDCEGSEALNLALREARAQAVLRGLTPQARRRIDAARAAPVTDCVAGDATEEERAYNRSAVFVPTVGHVDFPEEPVSAPTCPRGAAQAAGDISDYVSLVMCAEHRLPRFAPRDMLSLLRQIYYGNEAWSRVRSAFWLDVIPCGLALADPRPALGSTLFESLQRSKVVAGVDLGHLFTGLEAMVCPSASVTLDTPGPNLTVAIANEQFATWGGDLGSAAAQRVRDIVDLGLSHPWSHYFGSPGSLASDEDLEGDIDSFAIRAGLSGAPCAATALTALPSLAVPVSQMLSDYYDAVPGSAGAQRPNYARCVVQAIGGRVSGARITNKTTVIDAIRPGVEDFARTFYLGLVSVPLFAIGVPQAMALFTESREACRLFVDWLETKL